MAIIIFANNISNIGQCFEKVLTDDETLMVPSRKLQPNNHPGILRMLKILNMTVRNLSTNFVAVFDFIMTVIYYYWI
jgi:hypothetical protein